MPNGDGQEEMQPGSKSMNKLYIDNLAKPDI
jgi:hypothetical protein